MAIDIIVQRGNADVQAPDLYVPLLGDDLAAAQERGRVEIDKAARMIPVDMLCVFLPDLQVGDLVRVADDPTSNLYEGMIQTIEHITENSRDFPDFTVGAVTRLTILRPIWANEDRF